MSAYIDCFYEYLSDLFREGYSEVTRKRAFAYIMNKYPVEIIRQNVLNEERWAWAVQVKGSDEFWLDEFYKKQEAVEFCENLGLSYKVEGEKL